MASKPPTYRFHSHFPTCQLQARLCQLLTAFASLSYCYPVLAQLPQATNTDETRPLKDWAPLLYWAPPLDYNQYYGPTSITFLNKKIDFDHGKSLLDAKARAKELLDAKQLRK